MTKVCISGATGNVGQELIKAIVKRDDIQLVAAMGHASAGKRLLECVDIPGCPDIPVCDSVEKALKEAAFTTIIDYTTPTSVLNTMIHSIEHDIHCVVGTSGLTNEEFDRLDRLARQHDVGVITANFSVTATLMMHFSKIAARLVPHWEIMDYAADTKIDAPSGTARELAFLLKGVSAPEHAIDPKDVHGHPESRGLNLDGSQVHAVRLPGYYSAVEAIFGLTGERITIRHDSMSDVPYVEGTLLAAREISRYRGVVRGMERLLGLA